MGDKLIHDEIKKNKADQELKDDKDDEAKIWEPPKDELRRSVTDHFDECCDRSRFNAQYYSGKTSKDAYVKGLEQPIMQQDLDSKFKTIVSNLLNSEAVSSSTCHWVEIIAKLSWEAAQILNPFISGNSIDPNAYVKVKCLAAGSCNESKVFKGLVFTKHAAHKHMKTKYEHPRILLVKGELGQCSSDLSSFGGMFQSEERSYMSQVSFIEASQPNVIMVEKSVSRDILMRIQSLGVTLVSDMHFQRLQRISSCIGTPIVPSDSLLSHKLKYCYSFRIESLVEEHNIAGENGRKKSKSLMFLEGYPDSLGCTILLKGSDSDELKRVKKVVKYTVTLAYHLILETSFLLDQREMFSTILSTPRLQESVFDAVNTSIGLSSPPLPKYCDRLADHTPKNYVLDESIWTFVDDRKQQLLFDPRVSINTNVDDGNETRLDFLSKTFLVSRRNARRRIICDPSHFLNITFYKNIDVSLEKFLRDLFNLGNQCNACGELPQSHFYYYELHKVQLRIQLKRLHVGKRLPGEAKGNIWMWSRYGEKDVSKKVLISKATCSLSFGKFLDISFSQQTLLDKLSTSGHSFLQFFGFGYMVAMFSYSQVATYTAVLPPLKLKVGISLKASWLQKEFQSVITNRFLMFEEVTNFIKQRRSNKKSSGLSLSFIDELLEKEHSQFEENTKNIFDQAKTKLLSLNRMWWELFLQALVWNYRLSSLVLQNKDNDLIKVSSEQVVERDKTCVTYGSYNDQWYWISFEELRSKSIVDIEKEYMLKFKIVGECFQENLDIVNKIINEEGSRLHISLGDDHYFVVSDYEDEPSSLIACALAHLSSDEKRMPLTRCINGSFDKDQKLESLNSPKTFVTFGSLNLLGIPKYSVECLYAEDFRSLRKQCDFSELDYIDSLSRCEQREATDGKGNSMFFKTLNDMFIVKEITSIEYESFLNFSPEYFKYMKDTYELRNLTCLAKVFGIYQVIIRQPNGQGELRYNLVVMENLNFGRTISHEYKLKGPLLTRFITSTSGDSADEVLLGNNFFKDMNNSPVYFSKISKHNLKSAVMNDINFLDSINVMDYSLLVGIDVERCQLVCGIIGYLKQYTWDLSYPCGIL